MKNSKDTAPGGGEAARNGKKNEPLSLADIRKGFAEVAAGGEVKSPQGRYAAVALVFAGSEEAPELCFIRRAEREGDPWSGHMAFPGGMSDPADASPRAAAARETEEEVGLVLEERHYLAPLSRAAVMARGADTGIPLFPFLFYLGDEPAPLRPNGEVAEAFWIPLAHILDPGNFAQLRLERDGAVHHFPSVLFRGHHIWGVTYRVLLQFTSALGRFLPEPAAGL